MNTTTNQIQVERSTFVNVVAWIFIVMSGGSTLIGILQNIMINTMFAPDQMQDAMHATNQKQNIPPMAEFMFSHFQLIFAVVLALSVVTFASSIALLKRKNWARLVFICLMSLGIIWNIGSLFLQQAMFSSIPPSPPNAPAEFQEQFNTMATVMRIFSFVIAIGISGLFGWIIKRLTSSEIKKEF